MRVRLTFADPLQPLKFWHVVKDDLLSQPVSAVVSDIVSSFFNSASPSDFLLLLDDFLLPLNATAKGLIRDGDSLTLKLFDASQFSFLTARPSRDSPACGRRKRARSVSTSSSSSEEETDNDDDSGYGRSRHRGHRAAKARKRVGSRDSSCELKCTHKRGVPKRKKGMGVKKANRATKRFADGGPSFSSKTAKLKRAVVPNPSRGWDDISMVHANASDGEQSDAEESELEGGIDAGDTRMATGRSKIERTLALNLRRRGRKLPRGHGRVPVSDDDDGGSPISRSL